jgi:hypothetical protein
VHVVHAALRFEEELEVLEDEALGGKPERVALPSDVLGPGDTPAVGRDDLVAGERGELGWA